MTEDVSATPRKALARGHSTAHPLNVAYRIERIESYVAGAWLDFGCADGGYSGALLQAGASRVEGVDVEADRITEARRRNLENATFRQLTDSGLPFPNNTFDGAFVNEVLEHVENEQTALSEIYRVLRDSGYVIVISPNRWFPIDGHAAHIAGHTYSPVVLIPWLPEGWTRRFTDARNYWPHQLIGEVRNAGFQIIEVGYIWPVFEQYRWLPSSWINLYQRHLRTIDDMPGVRKFGLSTLVVGKKSL